MFERKVYQDLLRWKNEYCPRYACLLEGARRVGKTTIALAFARKEFETHMFSKLLQSLHPKIEENGRVGLLGAKWVQY